MGRGPHRLFGCPDQGSADAGRRRRRDHAVERPAVHRGPEARPGADHRLHVRAEAVAGDAARQLPARRGDHRGRPSRRCDQHRPGRPRDRRAPRAAPRVDKISFTGSTAAGMRIGELCGEQFKRCTLELGGKSAAIVLDDVDLTDATVDRARAERRDEQRPGLRRAESRILCRATGTTRWSTRSARPSVRSRSATRSTTPPRSARSSPSASAPGSRATSRPGRPRPAGVVGGDRPDLDRGWYVAPTVFADVDNCDEDRPGGDLRAGAVGHPLRQRGRGGGDRQRLRLRPVRLGLDVGPPARRRADRRPGPHRRGVDQHVDDPRSSTPRSAGSSTPASAGSSARRASTLTPSSSRSSCRSRSGSRRRAGRARLHDGSTTWSTPGGAASPIGGGGKRRNGPVARAMEPAPPARTRAPVRG